RTSRRGAGPWDTEKPGWLWLPNHRWQTRLPRGPAPPVPPSGTTPPVLCLRTIGEAHSRTKEPPVRFSRIRTPILNETVGHDSPSADGVRQKATRLSCFCEALYSSERETRPPEESIQPADPDLFSSSLSRLPGGKW